MRLPNYEEKPASSYGGLGKALLEKMGWTSGKGLGKNEDGMAEALAPKKKEDAAGVGASGRYPWEEKLWEKSFSQALSKLNGICDSSSDSDGDDSSSESDSDDAKKKQKKPADENIRYGELSGRDGIAVSGSKAELMIAKELAKDKWGRWGGREGKMARIAEAEAKAAAEMGLQPPPRSAFAPGDGGEESSSGSDSDTPPPKKKKGKEKKMKKKAPPSDAEEEEPAGKSGKAKGKKRSRGDAADSDDDAGEGGKKDKKRKKQAKAADTSDDDADASRGADGPAGPSGGVSGLLSQAAAWWGKYFVHAGNLEGLRNKKDRKRGFDEDDQENLYMKAHDGKAQGRLGLGVTSGSNPMKVAGARWKGKKVSFGEGEEGAAASDGDGAEDAEEEEKQGKPHRSDKAERKAKPATAAHDWGKVKWKAISEALLKEHAPEAGGKGMKLSKLRALALAKAEESLGAEAGTGGEQADAAFESRVLKSSRFVVEGKRIALAPAGGEDGDDGGRDSDEKPQKKKKKEKKASA